jgi:hypothetical protein
MVGVRAKVLGRLEWKSSLHPRAAALSCPPPAIYGPGLLYDMYPGPRCATKVLLAGDPGPKGPDRSDITIEMVMYLNSITTFG